MTTSLTSSEVKADSGLLEILLILLMAALFFAGAAVYKENLWLGRTLCGASIAGCICLLVRMYFDWRRHGGKVW